MKNYNIWYLDCGATEHMTPYLNKIKNFKKTFLRVHIANKEEIQAEGKGDVILKFSDKNGGLLADLADVLFVPNLGSNLLSVGRLVEKGLKITFEKENAKIINLNGEVILKAFRKNRLYEIEEETAVVKSVNGNLSLWHRRFGHFDNDSMKPAITKDCHRNIHNDDEESCPICTLGIMKSNPFCNSFRVSTTRPLELIHSDLVGPIEPTSQGGSKYFVSFIDDYSRYTVVFPIKSNNEVLLKFEEYRRMSENALGKKIQKIRTGNGAEYIGKDFEEYLTNHSIKRQCMVSGVPQRNSVAKNVNQKLLNMTRHMIKESGIPENLWADALVTACYVKNKCPSIAIHGKIPEELWTGKSVHTEHLRVFGCKAWIALNPGVTFGNLDFSAIECIFIGYSDEINCYKLWEMKRNVFFITDDVNFDEHIFPCKTEVSEEKVSDNVKSNIMTIKIENETEERPKPCSNNISNVKIVHETVGVNNTHEAISEVSIPSDVEYQKEITYEIPIPLEAEFGIVQRHDKPESDDEDEFSTTEEIVFKNTLTHKNKNTRERRRKRFRFRSKYFNKRKVFPLSNSKQKLIKSYRTKI